MTFHVCPKCRKHGDVTYNNTGFRQAFLAICECDDCPQTQAAKRFAAMFDGKPELPPDERNEK